MFDSNTLFEFSRSHCIAICAALVPANLLATLQTMLFAGFRRPPFQVKLMALAASVYAFALLLHVFTWFAIGVVMAPTFILTFLGCLCLVINFCAVLYCLRRSASVQLLTYRAAASATKAASLSH